MKAAIEKANLISPVTMQNNEKISIKQI